MVYVAHLTLGQTLLLLFLLYSLSFVLLEGWKFMASCFYSCLISVDGTVSNGFIVTMSVLSVLRLPCLSEMQLKRNLSIVITWCIPSTVSLYLELPFWNQIWFSQCILCIQHAAYICAQNLSENENKFAVVMIFSKLCWAVYKMLHTVLKEQCKSSYSNYILFWRAMERK